MTHGSFFKRLTPPQPPALCLRIWRRYLGPLSPWLVIILSDGYALEFARRPPPFGAVHGSGIVQPAPFGPKEGQTNSCQTIAFRAGKPPLLIEPRALCPLWFSLRSADTPPLGVDALAHNSWPQGLLYAFPPLHLLPPELYRVRSMALHILVVAPDSPLARCFPDLIQMLVEEPWPLPDVADALWHLGPTVPS